MGNERVGNVVRGGSGPNRLLRVAYLVQQFVPEVGAGPARVTELAKHWLDRGVKLTVITGMPNRPVGTIYPGYRGKAYLREKWGEIDVIRTWLYATPSPKFVDTLANNLSFMFGSTVSALLEDEEWDVLIASAPPFFVHLAGDAIARAKRIPLILEVRDLWPDYVAGMGVLKQKQALQALFGLERYLLRRAHQVVVVTDSFAQRVVEKGVVPERVTVIPNGVDVGQYYPSAEPPPVGALRRSGDEYIVGYLGNFGAGQGLSNIVEAAALLERTGSRIRFVLVGAGSEGEKLRNQLVALSLKSVTIDGPIPKEKTRAFYNNCDLCLVPLAGYSILQETIPSKIFEVMACSRPLLACAEGEAARIVTESGGGFVVGPGRPQALADSVTSIRSQSAEELKLKGQRSRQYVQARYSRETQALQFLEVMRKTIRTAAMHTSSSLPPVPSLHLRNAIV